MQNAQNAHYWKAQELISLVSQQKLGQFFSPRLPSAILFIYSRSTISTIATRVSILRPIYIYIYIIALYAYLTTVATVADKKKSVKILFYNEGRTSEERNFVLDDEHREQWLRLSRVWSVVKRGENYEKDSRRFGVKEIECGTEWNWLTLFLVETRPIIENYFLGSGGCLPVAAR